MNNVQSLLSAYPGQESLLIHNNPLHILQFSGDLLQNDFFPQFFKSHEQHISPCVGVGAGEVVGSGFSVGLGFGFIVGVGSEVALMVTCAVLV